MEKSRYYSCCLMVLWIGCSLFYGSNIHAEQKPNKPKVVATSPTKKRSVQPTKSTKPVNSFETQVEIGSFSGLLRIKRIIGVAQQPGIMTSTFYIDGMKITPETADAILFELDSSLSTRSFNIELQDQEGNVLSPGIIYDRSKPSILIYLLRSKAYTVLSVSVVTEEGRSKPYVFDIRRLNLQEQFF